MTFIAIQSKLRNNEYACSPHLDQALISYCKQNDQTSLNSKANFWTNIHDLFGSFPRICPFILLIS